MVTTKDQLLRAPPTVSNVKDRILTFSDVGIVDVHRQNLSRLVDYTVFVSGTSTGLTLRDPAVVIFNQAGNPIKPGLDGIGKDLFFTFRPPADGAYFIEVFD